MATKKVAATAASHDRNPSDVKSAAIPAIVPAAKTQPKVEVRVERKPSLAIVKATSSKEQTERTIPYVLLRKPVKAGAKATRSIVNFIIVGDTAEASHVRSMRIAIVNGDAFGTNFNVPGSGVTDIRKARFFEYTKRLQHGKTAKTVRAWDIGNEQAIRALEKLGAITKYDLEFHLAEAAKRKAEEEQLASFKAKNAQRQKDITALKALAKGIAKAHGVNTVRAALKASVGSLF